MISELTNATGNLSSLLNVVPTPGKLTIIPITELGPIPIPSGLPYVVMFNPENYSVSEKIHYDNRAGLGAASAEQRFCRKEEPSFSFEFTIDGTGASGEKREVILDIELLKTTVGFNGSEHKPNTLLLVWGTMIKICVLEKMEVKYTLLRDNGIPLRAVVTATFLGHTKKVLGALIDHLFSPDLSHRRMVKAGDTLPLMCNSIYDKPHFYLEVAKANGLTNFRKLKKGQTLDFPPVNK